MNNKKKSEENIEKLPDFVELGLRGHVAYATIHAGKVSDVILRLIQATDNPLDVINSINGIIVQSLYPKVCQSCHGKGCKKCKNTGQGGVVPIYEIAHFKNIKVDEIITEKGNIDFKKFFNFKALMEQGKIDYIAKEDVAKELFEKGVLFENDYKEILETSESFKKD